jgi:hypothetical protein
MERLLDLGVAAIITDRADLAVDVLRRRAGSGGPGSGGSGSGRSGSGPPGGPS